MASLLEVLSTQQWHADVLLIGPHSWAGESAHEWKRAAGLFDVCWCDHRSGLRLHIWPAHKLSDVTVWETNIQFWTVTPSETRAIKNRCEDRQTLAGIWVITLNINVKQPGSDSWCSCKNWTAVLRHCWSPVFVKSATIWSLSKNNTGFMKTRVCQQI